MVSSIELSPLNVSTLLRDYKIKPKKKLGQNFLIDTSTLQRIVESAEIEPDAAVLEIGPGLGSLTRHLALAARQVVAVELDSAMLPPLMEVISEWDHITIVQGDILRLDPAVLMDDQPYTVVANIPYSITSALIRHLLEARVKPERMVLTVQREVAQRICAKPGKLSLLALSVQLYGNPRIAVRIPAGSFYPAPKVDSAAIRIDLFPEPQIPTEAIDTFFFLAKAGFSQKRKTLRNALSAGIHWKPDQTTDLLHRADIDPMRRAETLSLPEWRQLTEHYLQYTS